MARHFFEVAAKIMGFVRNGSLGMVLDIKYVEAIRETADEVQHAIKSATERA